MVVRRHIWLKVSFPGSHPGPLSSMPPLRKRHTRRKWAPWVLRVAKNEPGAPMERSPPRTPMRSRDHEDRDPASAWSISQSFYSPKARVSPRLPAPGASSESPSPGTSSEPSSPGTSSEPALPGTSWQDLPRGAWLHRIHHPPAPDARHRNYGRWYQVLSWRTGIPKDRVKAVFMEAGRMARDELDNWDVSIVPHLVRFQAKHVPAKPVRKIGRTLVGPTWPYRRVTAKPLSGCKRLPGF